MMFKEGTKLYFYEVVREGGQDVLYVNYLGYPAVPSIADSASCMGKVVDYLIESPNASRIVFVQQRNYSYDFSQVALLQEIAQIYTYLIKHENILSVKKLAPFGSKKYLPQRLDAMRYLIQTLLKQDPIGCYFEAKRFRREERINARKLPAQEALSSNYYIRLLTKIINLLGKTKLLQKVSPKTYHIGDRSLYKETFRPVVIPNFTFTRLMASIPKNAELIDEYIVKNGYDESRVTILKLPGKSKYLYHIIPPEFNLKENFYELVNLGRNVLIEHKPKAEELTDPQRMRSVFFNIARDLLQELAITKKIKVPYDDLNRLANILVRHTIGFGFIEILLQDEKLQDIMVNSPVNRTNIFVRHQDYEECVTNIIPSFEDADSWAAKFRMLSGRPLDEANPILDTDLTIGKMRARVAIIQQPLSPSGLAYAFRRHRETPWTLPLFMKNGMISSLAAGTMSFLIDGARTLLVAGTRSAGKTSMLGALMLEIMPKYRIICIEDTLELGVDTMRSLGYDILRMKVRAALLKTTTEVSAEEGIRTSLRLGDSCLIVGEVRSEEAKALYEAMRIGALANVVAGTIHGASPYGVFDRVVNDLGVPITSFKATDIILVCNPIKSADGLHQSRRVTQIAEVRKHWTTDPLTENGFSDLFTYNVKKDTLEPTEDIKNGESEILKDIAGNIKGFAGDWDAVWDNITLRAKIKEEILKKSESEKMPSLIEAPFIVKSNNIFHAISGSVTSEIGVPSSERVFPAFQKWLKEEIKKKKSKTQF